MNIKSKRKALILTFNALVLFALLLVRDNQVSNFIQQTSENAGYNGVMLKAVLMLHNQSTYNWIAALCIGLLLINLFSYRQWVKSRRWILEPIIVLIISYGLAFSLYTSRTFKIADQLVKEERIKNPRPGPPQTNDNISPPEDAEWIDAEVLDSLRTQGLPH